jgi:hypothetical protein
MRPSIAQRCVDTWNREPFGDDTTMVDQISFELDRGTDIEASVEYFAKEHQCAVDVALAGQPYVGITFPLDASGSDFDRGSYIPPVHARAAAVRHDLTLQLLG